MKVSRNATFAREPRRDIVSRRRTEPRPGLPLCAVTSQALLVCVSPQWVHYGSSQRQDTPSIVHPCLHCSADNTSSVEASESSAKSALLALLEVRFAVIVFAAHGVAE